MGDDLRQRLTRSAKIEERKKDLMASRADFEARLSLLEAESYAEMLSVHQIGINVESALMKFIWKLSSRKPFYLFDIKDLFMFLDDIADNRVKIDPACRVDVGFSPFIDQLCVRIDPFAAVELCGEL